MCARLRTYFLSLRRKKVGKGHTVGLCSLRAAKLRKGQRASRIRRPALCAGMLRCSAAAGGSETRPAGSSIFASFPAASCATRLLMTAGGTGYQYRTPQGRAMARPCSDVLYLAVWISRRVAGLSSAAAGGSGRALFERSEFSPTPPDASSARHRAAALTSAHLLFAWRIQT